MAIDRKRILKNTAFMYIRMILVLLVSLYTSRVVLDKLGVEDFGLYNVIYSVIGILSFLNATLSSGTSRFITYELGTGDIERIKTTFSTTLIAHIFLALIILFFGESFGFWYVNNVMVIPPERLHIASIVYQMSILSTIFTILQVPFSATIIAYERMSIFAALGIIEVLLKLGIVYLITLGTVDKLLLYSILTCGVSMLVALFYLSYTKKAFKEVHFSVKFDKDVLKAIIKFSGWNIIANITNTLLNQGVIMLFNIFFNPVIVAAQAIASQLSNAFMQFINNVRVAVTPQVIKLYSEQKFEDSKNLTLKSAEYIFYLLLFLGLPCIAIMPKLMDLLLVDIPEFAIIFAQIIILQDILNNFNAAFYTPLIAANKVKSNSMSSLYICVTQFVLLYILFKLGCGPIWARILGVLNAIIYSFVVKPILLVREVNGYSYPEIYRCIWNCFKRLLFSGFLTVIIMKLIPITSILSAVLILILVATSVIVSVLIFMDKRTIKLLYLKSISYFTGK